MRPPPPWARLLATHSLTEVTDASGALFAGEVTGYGGSSGNWLFGVVDVHTEAAGFLMMSLGFNNKIYMGTLDLSALLGGTTSSGLGDVANLRISWTEISITGRASDHWHIWAFGYHWISYNDDPTNSVYLLRVTLDPTTGAPVRFDETLIYSESDSTVPFFNPRTTYGISTNDHFLVEVPGGIAVALWCPSENSLRIITVDAANPGTAVGGVVTFAGSAYGTGFYCNTTGSARAASPGGIGPMPDWEILVPDSIFPTTSSNSLHLWSTDDVFSTPLTSLASLTDASYNLQMATFERLANDEYVVAYKRVPTSNLYSDGSSVRSDYGDIILSIYDSTLSSTDQTVVCLLASSYDASSYSGNRPHVCRWGRYVITCWDEADQSGNPHGAFLRIDFLAGT